MKILFAYLLIINALSFLFMLSDKVRALKKAWRIPEARLLLTAILGGSLGMLVGMLLCRHKIRKPKFTVTVPLLLITHGLLVCYIISIGR